MSRCCYAAGDHAIAESHGKHLTQTTTSSCSKANRIRNSRTSHSNLSDCGPAGIGPSRAAIILCMKWAFAIAFLLLLFVANVRADDLRKIFHTEND